MKKKILFLITEDWFFCSHFLDRALAAKNAGYEIIVCSRRNKDKKNIEKFGFQFHNINFNRKNINPFYELIVLIQIIIIYKKVKPDTVHQIALKPIIYGSIAARFNNVRSVINAPVGMGYVFTSESLKARFLRPIIKFLLKSFMNSHHGMNKRNKAIFENNDDLNYFVKIGAVNLKDTSLIRGAGVYVKEDFIENKRNNERPIIALIGRMLRDKGIYEYIEAAKKLRSENIKAKFLLIGVVDEFNSSSINSEVLNEWHHEKIVDWLGKINNVDEILKRIDILCLPSYREGLPKALIEGAAMGLPIVTTNTVGCRDVVQDGVNGFLVPIKNSTALANAILKLIKDKKLRHRMGKESFKLAANKFSSRIIISQTMEIYDEMNS